MSKRYICFMFQRLRTMAHETGKTQLLMIYRLNGRNYKKYD